ncbi:Na+/H+ antiporter subunit E [Puniceicoccaceae bacterium K14]|nr:Na+/H+ antiporter subunit E [Puniceicoccaceae bacterium K14]
MKRVIQFIELLIFYGKEVIISNLKVARDVLGNSSKISPKIETLSVGKLSERQFFVLANMITMTPGTLTLEANLKERTITLHSLYQYTNEELQDIVSNQYERRVINVF